MKPVKQHSITNARLLLRRSEVGVLSTHSNACDGFPFGSVSTFMSTHEGDVVFYVSDLAQHTKNIEHNQKMCLTVFSSRAEDARRHSDDPNAQARLSLLGRAKRLDKDKGSHVSERFFRLYPDSKKYQNTHDFEFYKMRTERVRFIGGFGDIHWIKDNEWRTPTPQWQADETSMVQHMNEDHLDAMRAICAFYLDIKVDQVEMLAVTSEGAFYKCDSHKPAFIPFEEPAVDSNSVRKALVTQTNTARAELGIIKKAI